MKSASGPARGVTTTRPDNSRRQGAYESVRRLAYRPDLLLKWSNPDMVSRLARGSYPRVMTASETEAFVHEQQQLWKPALERIASQTN